MCTKLVGERRAESVQQKIMLGVRKLKLGNILDGVADTIQKEYFGNVSNGVWEDSSTDCRGSSLSERVQF